MQQRSGIFPEFLFPHRECEGLSELWLRRMDDGLSSDKERASKEPMAENKSKTRASETAPDLRLVRDPDEVQESAGGADAAESSALPGEPEAVGDGGSEVRDPDWDHPFGRTPPDPTPLPVPDEDGAYDLDSTECYLNRELTWLNFNYRVLHEARDPRTPLLERARFLAIVGSNLDEFFMKRIGGLKQQVGAGVKTKTVDGRTPRMQIEESYRIVNDLERMQLGTYAQVRELLAESGILLATYEDLTKKERAQLREDYIESIYPLVTPQGTDPAHPFPFISNLSLNLLVRISHDADVAPFLARVKVPLGAGTSRFLWVRDGSVAVPLELVMKENLDLLFPGMSVDSCEFFRVTRNANAEVDEETADDLLSSIQAELRERRFAAIVRLEVESGMDPAHRSMLASELGLDEEADVFEKEGFLSFRDLAEVADVDRPELRFPPFTPADNADFSVALDRSIFQMIRDWGSVLVHHPYESFKTSVERFLLEAARDPKVRAIKMTFYRTSEDTKALDYLVEAARNGKQVAVVMELKARFDEEANIRWANRLSEAGVHVTYGVVGLKTHCKVILVVRQDYDGLQRYTHVGTGNYHAVTARLYSDLGLFSADDDIGRDLTELFNYLTTGFKPKRKFKKLMKAPKSMRRPILDRIEKAISAHSPEQPSRLQFKMNALEEPRIVRALYEASQAGVRIDLIIRDSCRLRPGLPGLSENVRVTSIVGRFLEHSRVFFFDIDGQEEYFIGSADAMRRNLSNRVEVLVPVEDPRLRERLRHILDTQLSDRRSAWDMAPDGSYRQLSPQSEEEAIGTHERLIQWTEKTSRQAARALKRKPMVVGPREGSRKL